jgi:hypothetical protein
VPADLQSWSPEVDQEADLDGGGFQVVDDLGLMLRDERSDRFDLNEHTLIDNDVGNESPDFLSANMNVKRAHTSSIESLSVK